MKKYVNLPSIMFDEYEVITSGKGNCADALLDFYMALGWNPETHALDCCKVKLNPIDLAMFNENMLKLAILPEPKHDRESISLMLLDKSPSKDESVPHGKVWLQKDWIQYCPNEVVV